MASRGIIGRKPTITGGVYSDVFGPDTQFSSSTTGTWVSSNSSNSLLVATINPGGAFQKFSKLEDGKYHSCGGPDFSYLTPGYLPRNFAVSPDGMYVAHYQQDSITTGSTRFLVLLYKKVQDYYTEYKYIGAIQTTTGSDVPWRVAMGGPPNYLIFTGSSNGPFRLFKVVDTTIYGLTAPAGTLATGYPYFDWHPNGTTLAKSYDNYSNNGLQLYEYNGSSALTLTATLYGPGGVISTSANQVSGKGSNDTIGVRWHPSGNYLVIGGTSTSTDFRIIKIVSGTYTVVSTTTSGTNSEGYFKWSPSGKYLMVGLTNPAFYIFENETLTQIGSYPTIYPANTTRAAKLYAFEWMSDSEAIASHAFTEVWYFNGSSITRSSVDLIAGTWSYNGAGTRTRWQGQPRFTNVPWNYTYNQVGDDVNSSYTLERIPRW